MKNYTERFVDQHGDVRYFNSNGQPHRLNGPAVEYHDGAKYWWINNYCMIKSRHNKIVLFCSLEPKIFS